MSYKLIIIEDERIIREGLMRFEWEKIQVEAVASFDNGLSALEFLKKTTVDVVLTDIRMPLMDGIEFIRVVRKEFPDISIVCLSGYSDYEYLRECMQQGVKDYILKPTDKEELFRVISGLIELKKADSEESAIGEITSQNSGVYLQKHAIVNALKYIEKNYHRSIKLADVAESAYLNPVYFSHVFKQQMGIRFVDYLADFRIEKAIALMEDPTLTIHAIASSVGFFSSRYFAETFKKRKGMTPSEYRNKKKNQSQ